jgi:DNA repair protein RecO (recombination protein O)
MRLPSKTFNAVGIVLKRSNVGETDRAVSLLTREYGKIMTIAKGVRKLSSSKRAFLEPGNYVKAHFIQTKSMPLLTQASLIDDCANIRDSLADIRKLTQLLEIIEKLFVEEELEDSLFDSVLNLRKKIITKQASNGYIKQAMGNLIESLGYQHPNLSEHDSILDYVSQLADKPMRSFEYLSVKK